MTKTVLLAGAAVALALSAGTASAGAAHPTTAVKHQPGHIVLFPPKGGTLYDQTDSDGGVGLVSQNFESSFDAYDSQAADDFSVPAGHTWKVSGVNVVGVYFNGYGPASSENVFFYKDSKGLPGKLVAECDNQAGSDNGTGSFSINLSNCTGKTKFKGGNTYWVSVQANLNFSGGGEWGWEDRSVQSGNPAAWRNPGGGFGVCSSWGTLQSCLGYGPDLLFSLKGKDKT